MTKPIKDPEQLKAVGREIRDKIEGACSFCEQPIGDSFSVPAQVWLHPKGAILEFNVICSDCHVELRKTIERLQVRCPDCASEGHDGCIEA
tara:strand:+ start:258 stop:530 length:273 start_codon:yes stop_codon:yes gene_type:complete